LQRFPFFGDRPPADAETRRSLTNAVTSLLPEAARASLRLRHCTRTEKANNRGPGEAKLPAVKPTITRSPAWSAAREHSSTVAQISTEIGSVKFDPLASTVSQQERAR